MNYRFTLLLGVLLLAAITAFSVDTPPAMYGNNTSPEYYTESNTPVTLFPAFEINGGSIDGGGIAFPIKGLTISFTAGHHNDQDNLSIPNNPFLGINGSFDKSTGVLRLTGETSAQNYQTFVRGIKYFNDAAPGALSYDQRELTISFANGDYLESSGHFYEHVTGNYYWSAAKTAAAAKTYYGLQGYLCTVTSEEENNHILKIENDPNGTLWLGASDNDTEHTWKWLTGPENGDIFYQDGAVYDQSSYENWATGQPSGNEHYLQIFTDNVASEYTPGEWNDRSGGYQSGYIVEYGDMDGDPEITMTTTTTLDLVKPQPPVIKGNNDSSTYNTGEYNPVHVFPNFTVTDTEGSDIKGLTIHFSSGYQSNQDTLLFTNTSKITGYFEDTQGVLVLLGDASPAEYQAAMRSITYVNNAPLFSLIDGSQREFTISLANDNYFSQDLKLDNGHFYEYVNTPVEWIEAKAAASAKTYYGLKGYLATVTSENEKDFILSISDGTEQALWLGGSDEAIPDTWKWVTGPEDGTIFYQNGAVVSGKYENWSTDQPDDAGSVETSLQFFTSNGTWNDRQNGYTSGYIVEYGGMDGDPTINMTTTTTLKIDVVRPEAPGGIVDNLRVWFNANSGTSITNGNITSWEGQKPYGVNTTTVNDVAGDPSVVPNSANYNSVVSFDEDDAIRTTSRVPYTTYFNASSDRNTTFLVKKSTKGNVEAGYAYANGVTTERAGYFERAAGYQRSDYGKDKTILAGSTTMINKYIIARQDVQPGDFSLYLDGALERQIDKFSSLAGSSEGYLGFGANPDDFSFQSATDIAEYIIYASDLSPTEIKEVESYLALKYGISLNQTVATNYLASDGTVIWSATDNAGYATDVFGIGQDNASGLNQKVSRSVNNNNSPVLSTTANFLLSNADASRTALGEGNFMVMGHNNGTENSFTSSFNGGTNNRTDRVWKVDETGTVGEVYFAIPYAAVTFPSGGTPSVIISDDENFDDQDQVLPLTYNRTQGGYYARINPDDGDYIALAISEISVTLPTFYRTESIGGETTGITSYPSYSDFINNTNSTYTTFSQHWNFDDSFFADGVYFYRTNNAKTTVTRYPSLADLAAGTNGIVYNFTSGGSPQDWNDDDEFFASGDQFFRTASSNSLEKSTGLTVYNSFADLMTNTNGTFYAFTVNFNFEDQFFHDGEYFYRTNTHQSNNTQFGVARYASLSDLVASKTIDSPTFGSWSTNDDIFAVGITASFSVSKDTLTMAENAGKGEFTVVLDARPSTDVVLDIASDDTNEATVNKGQLTFTPDNWKVAQTITVTGVDDYIIRNDSAIVTVSVNTSSDNTFAALANQSVEIILEDDDVAGFTLSESTLIIDEDAGTASFTVVLNTQPISNVVFDVLSDDDNEAIVNNGTLTFTSGDWDTPQTITVTGVNDEIDREDDATITVSVEAASSDDTYDGEEDQTVAVTLTDDDEVPTVSTTDASSVISTSGVLGGNITDSGTSEVTETGVVYSSKNDTPEIGGTDVTKDVNGAVTGEYSETIESLAPNTTYYYQAYAISNAGISYGGVLSFKTKQTQVITFDELADKTYGDSDFDPEATASSNLTIAYSSSDTTVATIVDGNIHIVGAGSCTIYADQSGDDTYDAAIQVSQPLTVNKKPVTVTAEADQSKVYGESDPTLTYATSEDLETGDSFTGNLSRTSGEDVGTYAITIGTLSAGSNYDLTFESKDFTINKKSITVTADAGQSKVYGESDPTLTYASSEDLEAGDSFSGVLSRVPGDTVGIYAITIGTLSAGSNYDLTFESKDFTITEKAITVTADAKSKVYGETDPALTYQITAGALVGSDALTGSLSRDAGEDVGTYAITIGTLSAGSNYDLTFVSKDFSITEKAITVTADAKSKVYGETDPAFTYQITAGALVGSDALTGSLSRDAGEDVGTYAITIGTLSAGSNYDLTFVSKDFSITEKAITVTADAKSKVYGETDPALTYQITAGALVGSDALTGSLSRDAGEDVGTYAITIGTLSAGSNYDLTFVSKDFSITEKAITVTADAKSKVYGETDPAFTYQITAGALVGSDALTGSLSRDAGEDVGSYPITIGSLSAGTNYDFTFESSNFTINKKTITVTAADKSKTYGEANPELTFTYIGFVTGDNESDLTKAPVASTEATAASVAGNYKITVAGGVDENYTFTYNDATLTIEKATLTVTATAKDKSYDGTTTASITLSDDRVSGDMLTIDTTSAEFEDKNVGEGKTVTVAGIILSGDDANNYELSSATVSATADITPKNLTVSNAIAQNKIYDGTTDAVISGAVLKGVVLNDDVQLENETIGTFAQSTLGNDIEVTTSMTLSGVDAPNYLLVQPTGLKADITGKELTITGTFTVSDKEYDGTTNATVVTNNLELSGIEGEDDVTLSNVVIAFETASAGSELTVKVVSADLTGDAAAQYSLSLENSPTATASILLKEVTLSGANGITKTYDGNILLPSGTAAYGELNGILAEDETQVELTGNPLFDLADAGDRVIVQGNLRLTGSKADNYTFAWTDGTGEIEKATLTVVANNDAKFVTLEDEESYAGVSISGYVNGENSSVINQTGLTITRSNATENSAGEYTDVLEASGLTADNYVFNYLPGDYSIIPAEELLVEINDTSIAYSEVSEYGISSVRYLDSDGNTIKNLTENVRTLGNNQFSVDDGVGNVVSFTISEIDPEYNSQNNRLAVGAYQLEATAVSGSSNNFNNTIHVTGVLTVTTKEVEVQLVSGSEQKAFDGDANMDNLDMFTSDLVAGDDVELSGNGSFSQSEAGTDLAYSVTFALQGADKDNYHLKTDVPITGNDGKIAQIELTVTDAKASNKVYDGTTTATIAGATLNGAITGDDVTLANENTGAFVTDAVGNDIEILTSMTLAGADKDNYVLIQPSGLKASIEPQELTVANAAAQNKIYDGTTDATIVDATLSGVVADDEVLLENAESGTFKQDIVGTEIEVTTAMTISGADASNYKLIQPIGITADITTRELTVKDAVAENKVYDGTVNAVVSGAVLDGYVSGDDVILANHAVGTFIQSSVGENIQVVTLMTLEGDDKDNYTLKQPSYLTANITAAELTLSGSFVVNNKEYDGTAIATMLENNLQFNGLASGDIVSLDSIILAFETSNAGTGLEVYITGGKITGSDASKYSFSLNGAPVTSASINKKELTVTADNKTKEYDGSGYSSFTVSYSGFIDGEDETNLSGALSFAGTATTAINAGTDYTITPGGLSSENYAIVYVDGYLDIQKVDQTITFNPISQQILSNSSFELSAVASSGLTVEYSSSDESIATVSGKIVTFINSGTCTIYANQPGNVNYNAAEQVLQTLTIIPYISGDSNHDGKITPPEIAGDSNEDGQINDGEVAGDTNGDGQIGDDEVAGDTNGDGQINDDEVAGDNNGDGKITAPEVAGDTDGNGQIDDDEVAGDNNGDGKITAPEVAGDTDGNGQINDDEVAGDNNGDGQITEPEVAGDTDGNGQINDDEVAGDNNGDGKITAPEVAGDTDGNGQINDDEVAGDNNGDGQITEPEVAGDTDGNGQINDDEVAGDNNGDGKITAPEVAGDTDGNGQINDDEVAGDNNGDGQITEPEVAGDTDGNGQINDDEVAGDNNGDGKITAPEVAGDTDGNGQINDDEVAGDNNGDGQITEPEVAGDTDGNGQINDDEVAGDNNGDGKITAPEVAGDTDGNGQINDDEVAGDNNGDGQITEPEVAGDTDGNGQINDDEVAGDNNGDGQITEPEVAGDTDGNGQINDDEVAGDNNGDGQITEPEVAGDTDGNGQIDDDEVAGDNNGDGKITAPEVAGDTDGNGQIDDDEVAGDNNGDGQITEPEVAGDTDGNGQIDDDEVAGDNNGDGQITEPEVAGDTDGNGQINDDEVAGDNNGDGKITAPEVAGDTDGNGQINDDEVAGDNNGDGKITEPEVAGDTDGNGQINDDEVAGDNNGDGQITEPEVAGDTDGNGQINDDEVAGDNNGDGQITEPEVAGDTDGNGQIDDDEVAGDNNGDGKITAPEVAGDTDGNGQIDDDEVAGDNNGDGQITEPEVAGDTDGNGQINDDEVAGDNNGDGQITEPEVAGDTDGNGQINDDEVAGDNNGDGQITEPEVAGDTDGNGQIDDDEVAGDNNGDGKITAPEVAGDTDGNGQIDDDEVAGDNNGDGQITEPEVAGDTDGNGQINDDEVAGDNNGDGQITEPEVAGDTDGNGQINDDEVAGDNNGDGQITEPEVAGDTDGNGQIDDDEVAGDNNGDGKITAPEVAGDTDGNGQINDDEVAGDNNGDGKITVPEVAGDTDGNGQIDDDEVAGDNNGDGKITDDEVAGDTNGDGQIGEGEVAEWTIADISVLRINDEVFENPDDNIYYLIDCGATLDYVSISFELDSYASSSHLASFEMPVPTPGIYKEDIKVVSADSTQTRTYHIVVEKRFDYNDIVVKKYNNVLLVNNNPETNGGYHFSAFSWYKDGVLVGTDQYYSAGDDISDQLDLDAQYSVEMETEDGDLLQTCMFNVSYSEVFSLQVAPNPVKSGDIINVATTYSPEMLGNMNIIVKNISGGTVLQTRSRSNANHIVLPSSLAPGTYIVTTVAGGVELSAKIIVQ